MKFWNLHVSSWLLLFTFVAVPCFAEEQQDGVYQQLRDLVTAGEPQVAASVARYAIHVAVQERAPERAVTYFDFIPSGGNLEASVLNELAGYRDMSTMQVLSSRFRNRDSMYAELRAQVFAWNNRMPPESTEPLIPQNAHLMATAALGAFANENPELGRQLVDLALQCWKSDKSDSIPSNSLVQAVATAGMLPEFQSLIGKLDPELDDVGGPVAALADFQMRSGFPRMAVESVVSLLPESRIDRFRAHSTIVRNARDRNDWETSIRYAQELANSRDGANGVADGANSALRDWAAADGRKYGPSASEVETLRLMTIQLQSGSARESLDPVTILKGLIAHAASPEPNAHILLDATVRLLPFIYETNSIDSVDQAQLLLRKLLPSNSTDASVIDAKLKTAHVAALHGDSFRADCLLTEVWNTASETRHVTREQVIVSIAASGRTRLYSRLIKKSDTDLLLFASFVSGVLNGEVECEQITANESVEVVIGACSLCRRLGVRFRKGGGALSQMHY